MAIDVPLASRLAQQVTNRWGAGGKRPRAPTVVYQSIGLLSPFRSRVDHLPTCLPACLAELIDQRFTYQQIERDDILVGTAYSFQGDGETLCCFRSRLMRTHVTAQLGFLAMRTGGTEMHSADERPSPSTQVAQVLGIRATFRHPRQTQSDSPRSFPFDQR